MSGDWENCDAHRHGTVNAYRRGCRCAKAREARRLYVKRWREGRQPPGRVPSVGTARRLQALCAFGWSALELGTRLGWHRRRVQSLRSNETRAVTVTIATAVDRVFRELQDVRGGSARSTRLAARNGWVPAAAWDDIDDPTAVPVVLPAEKPDVSAEVQWLLKGGVPLEQAVARVGTTVSGYDRARFRRAS